MTNDASTLNPSSSHYTDLVQKIDVLSKQFTELHNDIQFIKDIFLAKQAKKERRRQKEEQERLEIERKRKAEAIRSKYVQIFREVTRQPWKFMPAPASKLSPKELELVSLLVRNKTDEEIARQMELRKNSIKPRICAANKKLGSNSRQELIAYYLDYQNKFRNHRHRRCLILLSWLLNPPPEISRNLKLTWKRTLGRGQKFNNAGPYMSITIFESLRNFEHRILKLKTQGFNNAAIAEQLKLKETTLKGYFTEIRAHNKWVSGAAIKSDEVLISLYKEYLKQERRRNHEK